MGIDVAGQVANLVGQSVPRPNGALSGHAAGSPFQELVHENLLAAYPNQCRRHFELLNETLTAHPKATSYEDRAKLFGPEAVRHLLMRERTPTENWSTSNLFEEKQDDTADSIILEKPVFDLRDNHATLVDVKTRNGTKKAQAGNVISAVKLAQALELSLEAGEVAFDLVYVSITFQPLETTLKCEQVHTVSLFKMEKRPYINWSAARQLQFHISTADQNFTGTREEWAENFMSDFRGSLTREIVKLKALLDQF